MECDAPISIRLNPPRSDGNKGLIYYFPAGCGKCLPCLMKRKAQWSYRIQAEARQAFSSHFVTLTYDEEHVPTGDFKTTANKQDHKLFIKNLKKLENPKVLSTRSMVSSNEWRKISNHEKFQGSLRYYGCIEYGDRNSRPHLHYILLNVRDINNINLAWTTKPIKTLRKDGYKPSNIGDSFGRIQVDECNINTIDYVLKYMIKDHSTKDYEEREKEKSFMSKGFGLSIADDQFIDYIKQPDANLVVNDRGTKIGLPRYYRKKFLSDTENNRKISYIRKKTEEEKRKKEQDLINRRKNPAKAEIEAKEIRRSLLFKKTNRELK